MLSPFLVSGNVGFKLPAVADWGERSDVSEPEETEPNDRETITE